MNVRVDFFPPVLALLSISMLVSCSTERFLDLAGSGNTGAGDSPAYTLGAGAGDSEADEGMETLLGSEQPVLKGALSLSECIEKALEFNRKRPASIAAIAIAEAQHQQALSSYWPQLHLQGTANLRSEDPNFVFPSQDFVLPETAVSVPAQQFMYPATTITTPASSMSLPLGPGGALVPIPIPSQNISVPAQSINVPAQEFHVDSQTFHLESQDIKVMDRWTYGGNLDLRWLLWNGGWRKALKDQSKAGIAAAKEDARRTDLEVVYDVRRMYQGAVLAGELEKVGQETLAQMEATLELTEGLYKGGSMQVKKTDYLRNKVLVDGLRSMVDRLEENRILSRAALANSMGASWRSDIRPSAKSIAFEAVNGSLDQLVSETYQFSPDWRQLEIGLDAAEAKIREEKASHMPKLAVLGNLFAIETPFEGGYATDPNLKAWNIGLGVEMPLFEGGLNKARVAEAKARLAELKEKKVLLKEGLALQVKAHLIQLDSMRKQDGNNVAALSTARENRELTEKAYRNDMIEADKVFSSQIMEAVTRARHLKLRFDHSATRSRLDYLVGRDMLGRLGLAAPPAAA